MTDQGVDLTYLTEDFWNRRWDGMDIPWHKSDVNPHLTKNISLLDGGKKDLRIFVPLCGKTLDMKWLFDLGHRVVGVDGCRSALEDFFTEHSMEYTVETRNGIPVLTEKSGRIVLYCCNILDFQKNDEERFDAVWDRGSFGVMNSGDRTRYVEVLTRLKAKNATHILELFEYDDRLYKESPFSIPMSKVLEYWGERHNVTLIDSHEALEICKTLKIDFKSFIRSLYLVTFK